MSLSTRLLLSACVALSFYAAPLAASEKPLPLGEITEEKLLEKLKPPATSKTRSMRNLVPAPREVNLTIPFSVNSAQISTEGEDALTALARAMNAPELSSSCFDLEGHTDRSGPLLFNKSLSERRAAAVKRFLEGQGIAPNRLNSNGYGWERLLPDLEPNAPEHRRVTVRAFEK